MAAAARPPGIGDARVPCPLCGGLIHPVAGRCKHCKEDLSSFRAGRPAAAAVLPALNGKPVAVPVAQPGNGTSVHAVAATTAYAPSGGVPVAVPAREGSAPILPQRTTGRSMSAQRPRGSLLRNWPMIVIILAMIAIVTAVVIMVLPTDHKSSGKRQLMQTPSPDRMETMPDKSSQADPWASPSDPNNKVAPPDPDVPDVQPRVTPDPPKAPTPPDDPDDLYGGLNPPSGGSFGSFGNGGFFINLIDASCKKLKSCPGSDQTLMDTLCTGFATMPKASLSSCASGQRCIDAIEKMDCNVASRATSTDMMQTMMNVQDCAKAITEC